MTISTHIKRNAMAALLILMSTAANATTVKLSNVPNYEWWYGCCVTSAGMMMGYYDRNGYAGYSYGNLVPGGVAELNTFPSTAGQWDYLAQYAIASPGHVQDFYGGGYGASGDDNYAGRPFDSLADFMGASQDAAGNTNGSTTLYYFSTGDRLTALDIFNAGSQFYDSDGMYGMWEYFDYSGYGSGSADDNFFTQLIQGQGSDPTKGFTFADYMAEIDAGRPMMIQVEGHSMLGYGYDDAASSLFIYDTWNNAENSMTWGGTYAGLAQWGVTGFIPTGSTVPIPEPSVYAMTMIGLFMVGMVAYRRRVA